MFRTHLEYSILFFGSVPKYQLKTIESLQKKCIRNVLGISGFHRSEQQFKQLGLLTVDQTFSFSSCKFMFNYVNGKLPTSFDGIFTPLHNYDRTNSFLLQRVKYKVFERFPSYFLPKCWNEIKNEVKSINSFSQFKSNLLQPFLS